VPCPVPYIRWPLLTSSLLLTKAMSHVRLRAEDVGDSAAETGEAVAAPVERDGETDAARDDAVPAGPQLARTITLARTTRRMIHERRPIESGYDEARCEGAGWANWIRTLSSEPIHRCARDIGRAPDAVVTS
jgi:hypothetical protein